MGWSYMTKPVGKTAKEIVSGLLTWEAGNWKVEALDAAIVSLRTAYVAVRRTNKETGVSYVFASVCLLNYAPSQIYDFGYKGIDETAGPVASECPERILKLLTPLDDPAYPDGNQWAKEWRERCWENIRRRKMVSSWKPGTRVDYPGGVPFSDGERHEHFVIVDPKKGLLKAMGCHTLYRMSRKFLAACVVVGEGGTA